MSKKEKKIFISSLVAMIMLVIGLSGYWILNKEQISVLVKGKEMKASTFTKTVKELLEELEIKYDEDDKIIPSLDTEVVDYMNIEVIDVTKNKLVEYEEIPFDVKTIDDKNLIKGKTIVQQEGALGKKDITYEITYENGVLVEKVLSQEVVSVEPIEKIVKKGIKEEIVVASRGESTRYQSNTNNTNTANTVSSSKGNYMLVEATAYSGHGITATGTKPKWGTIAVDPRVIPYGTKVYIPQFNMTFVAEDCGGAVKGNKIDIYMNSSSECYSWGRRKIDIYVLGR